MSDYIHSNDRRNPDCLWPIEPDDAATRVSPVERALWERDIATFRTSCGWLRVQRMGLDVFLWPSREGTYGAAIGSQYAERRHEGGHTKWTSLEAFLTHPLLQRDLSAP